MHPRVLLPDTDDTFARHVGGCAVSGIGSSAGHLPAAEALPPGPPYMTLSGPVRS